MKGLDRDTQAKLSWVYLMKAARTDESAGTAVAFFIGAAILVQSKSQAMLCVRSRSRANWYSNGKLSASRGNRRRAFTDLRVGHAS